MKFKFNGVMDMKIREVNENKKQFLCVKFCRFTEI